MERNIKTSNKKVKTNTYQSYVKPKSKYLSTVWHPWQKYLVYKIEQVQRSAARHVYNDYNCTSSISKMPQYLNCQTRAKTKHWLCNSPLQTPTHSCERWLSPSDPTRNLNYMIPYSRTHNHCRSFLSSSICLWNGPYKLVPVKIISLGSCILSKSVLFYLQSKSCCFLA